MALPMVTNAELVETLAEQTGFSKGEIRNVLNAIDDAVSDALKNCYRIKVAGVQIEPKLKKATKKRKGRNPATGEEVTIAAKPASVKVHARVTKALKEKAPSVKKLQNAL